MHRTADTLGDGAAQVDRTAWGGVQRINGAGLAVAATRDAVWPVDLDDGQALML
jgi:hypothetical protein